MSQFNLKKKQNRKKLFFNKDNILFDFGAQLLNSKMEFIKERPNSILKFGDDFNLNKDSKKKFLIDNFEELKNNSKIFEAFVCNFDLQIYFNFEKDFLNYIANSLRKDGLFCFNLITENSFLTLKKIFYEIDDVVYGGYHRRFGPFHNVQDIVEKLHQNNFIETVVSTERLDINYNSLKKMRNDFKEFGISNYYNNNIAFKKDFYIKSINVFDRIISKNDYIPIELEIATFTTWKYE